MISFITPFCAGVDFLAMLVHPTISRWDTGHVPISVELQTVIEHLHRRLVVHHFASGDGLDVELVREVQGRCSSPKILRDARFRLQLRPR